MFTARAFLNDRCSAIAYVGPTSLLTGTTCMQTRATTRPKHCANRERRRRSGRAKWPSAQQPKPAPPRPLNRTQLRLRRPSTNASRRRSRPKQSQRRRALLLQMLRRRATKQSVSAGAKKKSARQPPPLRARVRAMAWRLRARRLSSRRAASKAAPQQHLQPSVTSSLPSAAKPSARSYTPSTQR